MHDAKHSEFEVIFLKVYIIPKFSSYLLLLSKMTKRQIS